MLTVVLVWGALLLALGPAGALQWDRPRRMAPLLQEEVEAPASSPVPQERGREEARRASKIAVVGKCCPVGQNLSSESSEGGGRQCAASLLPFQPKFYDFNETGLWDYDINEWETIVGNPCRYERYLLDPRKYSEDEFYLLRNGSLVAPFNKPPMLHPKDFCMEAFWDDDPSGEPLALPLVCFPTPPTAPTTPHSTWEVVIAILMLISVPFLLATSGTHLLLHELRDTYGEIHCKALAVHTACLSLAFFSLAVTQLLVSRLSHTMCVVFACTIQVSFLACFFWLNILCVDIYLNVKSNVTKEEAERRCVYWGWWRDVWPRGYWVWGAAAPVLISLVTVLGRAPSLPVSLYRPNFGSEICWFESDASTWIFFYGPITALLCINLCLFVATARSLTKQDRMLNPLMNLGDHALPATDPDIERDGTSSRQRWKKYKKVFKLCLWLFLLMGISWVLEVLSWIFGEHSQVWYFSDLVNALQGIIIFFVFMPLSVLQLVWRRLTRTYPWLPGHSDQDLEVVSEMTSIGYNGATRLPPSCV